MIGEAAFSQFGLLGGALAIIITTLTGLVTTFVLMVLRGKLIPERIYLEVRMESKAKDATIAELTGQVSELTELARAWAPLISSIQAAAGRQS